jgi:S1-C subfamily serine protease
MDFGKVQRAMLGITMQEIDGELAKEKGIKDLKGVYIADLVKDGAADRAGVKISDQLTLINGIPVNSGPAVQEQISKFRPGDKISTEIIRAGKPMRLSIVLQGRR